MFRRSQIFPKNNHKKQRTFFLAVVFFLAATSLVLYVLISKEYEKGLTAAQIEKEQLLFNQLVKFVETEFIPTQMKSTKRSIEGIIQDTNIVMLDVTDRNDSTLVEFISNDYVADSDNAKQTPYKDFLLSFKSNESDYIQYKETIITPDDQFYKLNCKFSRVNLNSKIKNSNVTFAIICGTAFLLGIFVLFFASYIFVYPIKKISETLHEISSGNYSKRYNIKSKNEFSTIAASINTIAENLQKSQSHLDKLNKELKFQIRDKIGELNYEINKKRQAETLLKQSEEQFRLLFELAPIGMFISTTYGNIIKANAAFCTTLGYSEEEILNKKARELTLPDDQELDVKAHQKLIDFNYENEYYEKRMVRKDGKIIFVIVEAVCVKNKDGSANHIIEQVIDITERKRVEQELILAKDKAEESDRLKSAFLAQMSHEIRTPLNVILTAMEIIREEISTADEENKLILESVSSAGKRLQRTIDLILDISAVQSGNYNHAFIDYDLNKELKILIEEFKSVSAEKGIKISYANKASSSIVRADHYSITQVFQNLIDNALKYTLKGGVDVIIEDLSEDKMQVKIKDSGIGISKEYLDKLFNAFSQEDVGQRREFDGNGLGLALVKNYVEINNAEILVDSVKDKGSVFTVVFNKKGTSNVESNSHQSKTEGVGHLS